MSKNNVKIIPLGGLGEIGMNMMAIECGDSIVVVDSGIMFPDPMMLGVDQVIPDITYLKENKDKVKALLITHGHEDHIGAIPFIIDELNVPIYATKFTVGLIKAKLDEFDLKNKIIINTVTEREIFDVAPFSIEYIHVCHSIINACSLAITTPQGVIIHTADFRFDETPADGLKLDRERFEFYGDKGVRLLLSDSTNIERDSVTLSETVIGKNIEKIFKEIDGRIIIATFSSNIHRVQLIINSAVNSGRRVILCGRSMIKNTSIADELGYMNIPAGVMADLDDLPDIADDEVVIITTGTQGEPMSALTRMAIDEHKQIKITEADTVILSSKFIPGNEKAISNMMNHLCRRGAHIIFEKMADIHTSGHASRGELAEMLKMTRPDCFIPVHGEYRHLTKHAELAESQGVDKENIKIIENGTVCELSTGGLEITGEVESGKVFVDGGIVGDVSKTVLRDRKKLGKDGMIVAVIAFNQSRGDIVYGPELISKGLTLDEEESAIMMEAKENLIGILNELPQETKADMIQVKEEIRLALRRFFNKKIDRKPVLLPMVIEI